MAYTNFTTAQVAQIRKYLGYPNQFRYLDPRLESAIVIVDQDADAFNLTVGLLTSIAGIETELSNRLTEIGLRKADEVEWHEGARRNGVAGVDGVRAEGRRFCSQLSQLMGVPLAGDAFGERGYGGDWWMHAGTQSSDGGGVIPLG
jgi:hypothetical protein